MPTLFKWGGRKDAPASPPLSPTISASETISTTKVLPRVIAALGQESAPVILDLGPVVGSNISFFGEQLSCKIFVEDLFAEVEAQARAGSRERLTDTLPLRLQHEPGSIDGVLCWDLFDFLDKRAGQALAARLLTLLRPGGIIYGFFGQTSGQLSQYTRFIVESGTTMKLRTSPATPTPRTVIVNRDLGKMFQGMVVAESVLLKNSARETLFRKPS